MVSAAFYRCNRYRLRLSTLRHLDKCDRCAVRSSRPLQQPTARHCRSRLHTSLQLIALQQLITRRCRTPAARVQATPDGSTASVATTDQQSTSLAKGLAGDKSQQGPTIISVNAAPTSPSTAAPASPSLKTQSTCAPTGCAVARTLEYSYSDALCMGSTLTPEPCSRGSRRPIQ